VTSWNWVFLADFASFKPAYLPADNPVRPPPVAQSLPRDCSPYRGLHVPRESLGAVLSIVQGAIPVAPVPNPTSDSLGRRPLARAAGGLLLLLRHGRAAALLHRPRAVLRERPLPSARAAHARRRHLLAGLLHRRDVPRRHGASLRFPQSVLQPSLVFFRHPRPRQLFFVPTVAPHGPRVLHACTRLRSRRRTFREVHRRRCWALTRRARPANRVDVQKQASAPCSEHVAHPTASACGIASLERILSTTPRLWWGGAGAFRLVAAACV
jgi:hypothetical protein